MSTCGSTEGRTVMSCDTGNSATERHEKSGHATSVRNGGCNPSALASAPISDSEYQASPAGKISAVNACGASESTAQGKSVSPQKGSATALSSELGKCYIGVDRLLEIAEFAETYCIHGINLNHNCPECDLDDAINGQNDSEAASEDSFGRINP